MAYHIYWEPAGVYRRYSGHTSFEELVVSVLAVENDPRFDEIRYVINDFLASEQVSFTPEGICELSAVDGAAERSNPNIRIAIVADRPAIRAAGEAYIAAGLNTYETRLFDTLPEARRWAEENLHQTRVPTWQLGRIR